MRSPSWRLTLRVIAVLSWVVSMLWFIVEPGYEPLLAVLSGVAVFLGSFAVSDAPISSPLRYSPTPEQRQRNRRAMLELVKSFWVKGVLEQSLHGAAMIELGLERRADAVERPWDMVLQTPDQPNRPLPHGTKIVEVFDEMNRALLILGEPGSGKTTMLLELARDTIARAEKDPTQPIPVVFNLSSWADKQQPITGWLVDELNAKYNVPGRIARLWVEHDDLLLLLDGLDEVAQEHRDDCVRAINDFHQEHMVPLAVCSRIADYEALTTRLRLQGAVFLQPLTPQQVDEYLEGAGLELLAVHRTLQHDTTLQELVQSPLMLSIMTLAYQGISVKDLGTLDKTEARRRHVLDTYVQRMFKPRMSRTFSETSSIPGRKQDKSRFSPQQTIHWLGWLARRMSQHSQTVFLIERMQPSWLQTRAQQWMYVVSLVLIVWLMSGLVGVLINGLTTILMTSFTGFFIVAFQFRPDTGFPMKINTVESLNWSWRLTKEKLKGGLGCGLILGLFMGLLFCFASVLGPVISSLPFSLPLDWRIGLGLMILAMILIMYLIGGLSYALIAGLTGKEIEAKTVPNQGIRQSARNAVIVGLSFSLASYSILVLMSLSSGLIIAIGSALFEGYSNNELMRMFIYMVISAPGTALMLWPIFGWGLGPFGALSFGGSAFIQHFLLRFILYLKGYMPWNYIRFLDHTTDRIFLRKVGGGYIFIHRLLQDYFASLYQGQ